MERDYIGEIDGLRAELNNCRQGVIRNLPLFQVFLHDMPLGLFASREGADAKMAEYRQQNPGAWRKMPGGRWVNDGSPHIARLEAVEIMVQP